MFSLLPYYMWVHPHIKSWEISRLSQLEYCSGASNCLHLLIIEITLKANLPFLVPILWDHCQFDSYILVTVNLVPIIFNL